MSESITVTDIQGFFLNLFAPDKTSETNVILVLVTGAGTQLIPWILQPGASRSLMRASVPYATSALQKTLQYGSNKVIIDKYVSNETAYLMACASKRDATNDYLSTSRNLRVLGNINVIGIGLTATIVTNRPKAGPHECIVAFESGNTHGCMSIQMSKGARTRDEEDYVCSRLALELLCMASGKETLRRDFLFEGEEIHYVQEDIPDVIDSIRAGETSMALFVQKPDISDIQESILDNFKTYSNITLPEGSLVYPGSFNPLHEGHVALIIATILSRGWSLDPSAENAHPPVVFEISVVNADKPSLGRDEIIRRIKQFTDSNPILKKSGLINYCVCITSVPFFLDKSNIFRECMFVIGADTLSRIINPRYYGNNEFALVDSLGRINQNNCKFIVGGRIDSSETFQTADTILSSDLAQTILYSDSLKSMFIAINEFRFDLSSTQIRQKM
jgi:nicotinic acid mononucleotide adenylyltransferase